MSTRAGSCVIAFGGPHQSDDIRPFLRHVLMGRPVPEERFESVVHHYELLGGTLAHHRAHAQTRRRR